MKPTEGDIVAVNQLLALLDHVMDQSAYDRLGEVFVSDAVYDCSIFGFGTAIGIDEIRALLSREGHALAHHCTNVFVHDAQGDALAALSKGWVCWKAGRSPASPLSTPLSPQRPAGASPLMSCDSTKGNE